ncbi:MAG: glycoside hydrolase family 127 protein [Anaerolineae bacterium]|nr:glycoside hydrolase family 127 protein [Anaerolineae bacterium]
MKNHVTPIRPQAIRAIDGFMGQRFDANRNARLKDVMLSEQFIRLHEHKNHDDWFWMGEQIGKWLDAAAYTALITKDDALRARIDEIICRLEKAQEEDGYLGITARHHRNPVRGMELYEMYYILLGLETVYELLGNQAALDIACKLADYIIQTWGPEPGQFPLVGRFPGNGHDGGEGTLIIEPVVALTLLTGDQKYVQWGESVLAKWDEWWEQYPGAIHACGWTKMKQFAAGEIDLYELRPNIHAHTYHMTLLGIAALYNVTGNEEYRQVVLKSIDRIAGEWLFLTGGMSSGERYLQREYYHPRNDVEVCPQHTWLLLLDQALRWTGEARYADEIERDLFNHFLAAQLADGSNWSYMTPLNGQAQEPSGPNCCNAAGHRIAGRMPTYLYGLRDSSPAVFLYTESEAVFEMPDGCEIALKQETDYPSLGQVTIHVVPEEPSLFALHLRIPAFAVGATYRINNDAAIAAAAGDFAVLKRQWQPGDKVELHLPMPVSIQASDHLAAIVRGPLVYCLFQDVQDKPGSIYWHRGIYPEDHQLLLDLVEPEATIQEEPARPGLLGPALRVQGHIRASAPIFAAAQANAGVPPAEFEGCLLLPFANQGAVRGEYRVFNHYKVP